MSYGYGMTSEYWTAAAVRAHQIDNYTGLFADYLYRLKQGSYEFASVDTMSLDVCFERRGSSEIRNGDSRGPWVSSGPDPILFGVTSFSIIEASGSVFHFPRVCTTDVTRPALHGWIANTAKLVAIQPGHIYQARTDSMAWLALTNTKVFPIRTERVLRCLAKLYSTIHVPLLQMTELPLSTGRPRAICK